MFNWNNIFQFSLNSVHWWLSVIVLFTVLPTSMAGNHHAFSLPSSSLTGSTIVYFLPVKATTNQYITIDLIRKESFSSCKYTVKVCFLHQHCYWKNCIIYREIFSRINFTKSWIKINIYRNISTFSDNSVKLYFRLVRCWYLGRRKKASHFGRMVTPRS